MLECVRSVEAIERTTSKCESLAETIPHSVLPNSGDKMFAETKGNAGQWQPSQQNGWASVDMKTPG